MQQRRLALWLALPSNAAGALVGGGTLLTKHSPALPPVTLCYLSFTFGAHDNPMLARHLSQVGSYINTQIQDACVSAPNRVSSDWIHMMIRAREDDASKKSRETVKELEAYCTHPDVCAKNISV